MSGIGMVGDHVNTILDVRLESRRLTFNRCFKETNYSLQLLLLIPLIQVGI